MGCLLYVKDKVQITENRTSPKLSMNRGNSFEYINLWDPVNFHAVNLRELFCNRPSHPTCTVQLRGRESITEVRNIKNRVTFDLDYS
jgi:hypothetical protein